jgi:hypothetical protein
MKQIKQILEKVYENKELRKRIVPLFLGNPGLGKTALIEKFVEEKGVQLVELITSQMSPFEISGIAMPDKDTQKMTYYNFDKLENLKDGDVLFFDELLNGNPVVLNACLTILEQRRFISGKPLPDIMIVAAANPQGMAPLTPQIKERFTWYNTSFDPKMWREFMENKYNITSQIGEKLVSLIQEEQFTGNNFHTPRSIDKAVNMIIYDVPTPYERTIFPILNDIIKNPFEAKVQLTETRTLEKEEMISWLDLIRIKYNVVVDKPVEPVDDYVLPEKWCIKSNDTNRKTLRHFINLKGYSTWNNDEDWYVHYPFIEEGSLFSKIREPYTEITFEQFEKYVLNKK